MGGSFRLEGGVIVLTERTIDWSKVRESEADNILRGRKLWFVQGFRCFFGGRGGRRGDEEDDNTKNNDDNYPKEGEVEWFVLVEFILK